MKIMAKWMRLESPSQCSSDNDDSYDIIETNNMCTADEPIDLNQVNCESHPAHEDTSNDWDTSRLVKTKTFRIKDILGLDDNEKISSAKSMPIGFTTFATVPTTSPSTTVPSMYSLILWCMWIIKFFIPIKMIRFINRRRRKK